MSAVSIILPPVEAFCTTLPLDMSAVSIILPPVKAVCTTLPIEVSPVNQYPFVMERRNTTYSILHISLLFFVLIKYKLLQ